MRGTAPVLIVLVLGVAGMMLGASGFDDAWGAEPPKTGAAQEQVENSSKINPSNDPISGPVSSGDSSIVGLISSGIGSIVQFAGAVALLPVTLINLGFPAWFAGPLGLLAQVVAAVSIIQFATNREWS